MPVQAITAEEKVAELLALAKQEGDCLISHLAPNAKGYVPVSIGGRKGKKWRAHRLVYCVLVNPNLPEDVMVLHSCDVRNCINLEHLFEGTAQDNTDDMMKKGRHNYIVRRIVTPDVLKEIFYLHEKGLSNVKVGKQLGISHETVREYVNCSDITTKLLEGV